MIGLLASGGINLLPDKTFFIQLVIFLFVVAVLGKFVIRPTMAIIRLRHERTAGAEAGVDSLMESAERTDKEIENRLDAERRDASARAEAKRKGAQIEAKRLVDEARARAKDHIEERRRHLGDVAGRAREDLSREAPQLTRMIMERMTGERGASS